MNSIQSAAQTVVALEQKYHKAVRKGAIRHIRHPKHDYIGHDLLLGISREPTSFLDIGYQIEILNLVHQLSRERGVSIVMAIHDLNQAMSICDQISLLSKGELMFDGAPRALAESGLIEEVFRVKGRFVEIAQDAPPHFDVELARRTANRAF